MRPWPRHGWFGLALVGIAWPLTWLLPGMRSHVLFFPLWLGYVLTVDALTVVRSGSSLWTRSRRDFARLFAASVPAWWFFELLNRRLGNWVYVGGEELGPIAYAFWASLDFSTVIPAVFATAELLRTFAPEGDRTGPGRARWSVGAGWLVALTLLGAGMLALLLLLPRYGYPLAWVAPIFLLDPLCHRLGRPSLLRWLEMGRIGPLLRLAAAALVCGLFWECWNVYAWPKWVYRIPFFDFWRVFEMPLPGYLGYLPFGLGLYPMTHVLLRRPPALEV